MRIHWAKAALAAAMLALGMEGAAEAAPLLIDDFASRSSAFYIIGTPAPPFFPNAQPVEESGLPTTIGEERDTLVEVLGTPNAQSAQFLLGGRGLPEIDQRLRDEQRRAVSGGPQASSLPCVLQCLFRSTGPDADTC